MMQKSNILFESGKNETSLPEFAHIMSRGWNCALQATASPARASNLLAEADPDF